MKEQRYKRHSMHENTDASQYKNMDQENSLQIFFLFLHTLLEETCLKTLNRKADISTVRCPIVEQGLVAEHPLHAGQYI